MNPCGGKEDQMFHKLAAGKTSINFGPQRIQNARHSQGDDDLPASPLPRGRALQIHTPPSGVPARLGLKAPALAWPAAALAF